MLSCLVKCIMDYLSVNAYNSFATEQDQEKHISWRYENGA